MRLVRLLGSGLAIAMSLASCGDDGGGGDAQGGGSGAKAAPAAAKPGAPLRVMTHVEDRVTTQREKQSIRHPFKERDFASDANRDPFLSPFMSVGAPDIITPPKPGDTTVCEAKKQKAGGFSYNDLRLVGIQAIGTQRKALVMGGSEGYTIKRLDCVGKEKAIVDEISDAYVRLKIASIAIPNGPAIPPETHDIELHPKELSLDGLMDPNRVTPGPAVPDVPLKPTAVPAANVPAHVTGPPVNNPPPTQPPTTLTP